MDLLVNGKFYTLTAEQLAKIGYKLPPDVKSCTVSIDFNLSRNEEEILTHHLYFYLLDKGWSDNIAYDAVKDFIYHGNPLAAAVEGLAEDRHVIELHDDIKSFIKSQKK